MNIKELKREKEDLLKRLSEIDDILNIENIKRKIIELFKNDYDLLYSTLREELLGESDTFDNITVFDNESYTISCLEDWYQSSFYDNFDYNRKEKYFTYNKDNDIIKYYNDLETALTDALNSLEEIADYICRNNLDDPEGYRLFVLNRIFDNEYL